jgi:hypothetical protein
MLVFLNIKFSVLDNGMNKNTTKLLLLLRF